MFYKKSDGANKTICSLIKCAILLSQKLTNELDKTIIRIFRKNLKYAHFLKIIYGVKTCLTCS